MLLEIERTPMGIYVVRGDTVLAHEILEHGTLDLPRNRANLQAVAPYIPEGGVVIEAGACIGDHTVIYSQMVGADGEVYAFEPHPASRQALLKNTERLSNVIVSPYGLSDCAQEVSLSMTPNVGASFVDGGEPSTPIRVQPLDNLMSLYLPRIDFIHLDAEGMEAKILTGAVNLLAKFRPVLLIEVVDRWQQRYGSSSDQLFALLDQLGYDVQPLSDNTDYYDVLCRPR